MSVIVKGSPWLLMLGTFLLLPLGAGLVSGQGSLFCPHLPVAIPSAFLSGGRHVLGFPMTNLDCCRQGVFSGWCDCLCGLCVCGEGPPPRSIPPPPPAIFPLFPDASPSPPLSCPVLFSLWKGRNWSSNLSSFPGSLNLVLALGIYVLSQGQAVGVAPQGKVREGRG